MQQDSGMKGSQKLTYQCVLAGTREFSIKPWYFMMWLKWFQEPKGHCALLNQNHQVKYCCMLQSRASYITNIISVKKLHPLGRIVSKYFSSPEKWCLYMLHLRLTFQFTQWWWCHGNNNFSTLLSVLFQDTSGSLGCSYYHNFMIWYISSYLLRSFHLHKILGRSTMVFSGWNPTALSAHILWHSSFDVEANGLPANMREV